MRTKIVNLLEQSLQRLIDKKIITQINQQKLSVTPPKYASQGDYATNAAMIHAKQAEMSARQLAEIIIAHLPSTNDFKKIEIAGPGFINFFLKESTQVAVIETILNQKHNFGCNNQGNAERVNIEYVSANPTGPLHVGHGRGAAIGSSLAQIMRKCGYQVTEEYYINDYGRQINILALSVWLRYLQQFEFNYALPSKAYQGQYIKSIAHTIAQRYGQRFMGNQSELQSVLDQTYQSMADIPDQEHQIDYLIKTCQNLLGYDYNVIHDFALHAILEGIKADLEAFNVNMDVWFSENALNENNQIHKAINQLTQGGWIYRYENAQWFASSKLGDDKDRVIVRSNGNTTYFASDAAYLNNKFQRDYDHIIYLLGADHHGYVPRLKALAKAFNYENAKMYVPLVQFANLYKNGNLIQMSTRSGSFITLRQLVEEVGTDATRFFYLMRKSDQHLDFDMDLAKSKTSENPVFYVQYAHARICSVFKQLSQHNVTYEQEKGLKHIHLLTSSHEQSLANHMAQYPEVIKNVNHKLSPHLLTIYLKELATYFHAYYNAQKFISNDEAVMQARLCLIKAVQYILKDGFYLLKISPVEQM